MHTCGYNACQTGDNDLFIIRSAVAGKEIFSAAFVVEELALDSCDCKGREAGVSEISKVDVATVFFDELDFNGGGFCGNDYRSNVNGKGTLSACNMAGGFTADSVVAYRNSGNRSKNAGIGVLRG